MTAADHAVSVANFIFVERHLIGDSVNAIAFSVERRVSKFEP